MAKADRTRLRISAATSDFKWIHDHSSGSWTVLIQSLSFIPVASFDQHKKEKQISGYRGYARTIWPEDDTVKQEISKLI